MSNSKLQEIVVIICLPILTFTILFWFCIYLCRLCKKRTPPNQVHTQSLTQKRVSDSVWKFGIYFQTGKYIFSHVWKIEHLAISSCIFCESPLGPRFSLLFPLCSLTGDFGLKVSKRLAKYHRDLQNSLKVLNVLKVSESLRKFQKDSERLVSFNHIIRV